MATSLNSILDANPELTKAAPVAARPTFSDLAESLSKMGQRHGKKDKALVQKAHDAMAELVDGANCGKTKETSKGLDVSKANARHSKADLALIKTMHDGAVSLGADCPLHKDEGDGG